MAVGTLHDYAGKLDCQTCDDKLKEERGHSKDGILPFMVNGERVFRCPITFITPLSWEYLRAFTFYEKALMPNGEGWVNESNKFIEAMTILNNEFIKYRNKNGRS